MTVRLATPAFPGDKATIFHAHQKVAHRADPRVTVEAGNHNALGVGLDPIRAWHPIEVLHFSFRSVLQLERKGEGAWLRTEGYEPTLHQFLLDEALRTGRLEDFYASFAVTDAALERGARDGTLAVDTRLRDALRALRAEDGAFRLPIASAQSLLSFPRPDVREDGMYAGEAAALVDIDGVVRAERRVDAFEERLAALERGPLSRLHRLGLPSR